MRTLTAAVLAGAALVSAPCRADDRAQAIVRDVLQQAQEVRPAAADCTIECSWNKQPALKWTMEAHTLYSSLRFFVRSEQFGPKNDVLFPTGLFALLCRQIEPLPDAATVGTTDPVLLPTETFQGEPCSVIEFTGALPAGDLTPPHPPRFTVPARNWDRAMLRWYVDGQHHIRRITGSFRWNEWAGESDVRLTMDAHVIHRKPRTGVERPLATPLHEVRSGPNPKSACLFAYSPDGKWLALAGSGGVTLAATSDWKATSLSAETEARQPAFSRDSAMLACAYGEGGKLRVWDVSSRKEQPPIETGFRFVQWCAFLPDGRLLISTYDEGSALWDFGTRKLTRLLGASIDRSGTVSPDGRWLASDASGTVLLQDMAGELPDRVLGMPGRPRSGMRSAPSVAFSPNGKLVAIGNNWGPYRGSVDPAADRTPRGAAVQIFDVATGSLAASLQGVIGTVLALAFSPDGRMLAAGDMDNFGETEGMNGGLTLWDTTSWKVLGAMAGGEDPAVRQIEFAHDGTWIATAGYGPLVKVWAIPAFALKRP
jgi:WD40 repeat protein